MLYQSVLSLPEKNEFIPTSLAIKPKAGFKKAVEHPAIIKDVVDRTSPNVGSVRVWFKQDAVFKRPRGNVVCKWWSSQLYATPRDVVMSSLYTKMVRDILQELSYPASIAGFEFAFSSDVDGLDLHVSGYDSGLLKFTRQLSKYVMLVPPGTPADQPGAVPDRNRFNQIKEELQESYKNFMYGQAHIHAAYAMSLLLEDPHWHVSEYMDALRDIQKPIGLADYELTRALPQELASKLPSIEDIEAELSHDADGKEDVEDTTE